MTNPYHTPAFDPKQFQDQPAYSVGSTSDFGWVRQVRTFAILNAVQGMLEIPMGLFITGMAFLFPVLLRMNPPPAQDAAAAPSPEDVSRIIAVVYLAIGIPVLVCGILRIVAAVHNYRFKGRTLGLVSIIAGMVTLMSCYCAPTAVGLLVYGLILHLNPAVKAAFEMARHGRSAQQILTAFSPGQPSYYGPFPPPGTASQLPPSGENPFSQS